MLIVRSRGPLQCRIDTAGMSCSGCSALGAHTLCLATSRALLGASTADRLTRPTPDRRTLDALLLGLEAVGPQGTANH